MMITMNHSFTPQARQEIAQTNWSDAASVARVEEHAKNLFAVLSRSLTAMRETEPETKARAYTVGAIVNAFPRAKRTDIRPKVEQLVARATGTDDTKEEPKEGPKDSSKSARKRGKK